MNFVGKWMDLVNVTLSEVTQSQKDMGLTYKRMLAIKYKMTMLHSTNQKKLNKKESSSKNA